MPEEAEKMLLTYWNDGVEPDMTRLKTVTELYLFDCKLTDISILAELTNLTELNLGYNYISDISPLKNLINLE